MIWLRLWLAFNYFNSLFLHLDFLYKDNISKELNLILIKSTFYYISKELEFLKLVKNQTYGFYMWLAWLLDINQNIIQIHNDKNIKLFNKNLIDAALKTGRNIKSSKNITWYLKWLYLVWIAVFYLLFSWILILG